MKKFQTMEEFLKLNPNLPDHSSRVFGKDFCLPYHEVSITPSKLFFGSVLVGEPSSFQTITVTNTGLLPVTVKEIVVVGPYEASSNHPVELAPEESFEIQVTFHPEAVGTVTGGVHVVIEKTPTRMVELMGYGKSGEKPPEPVLPTLSVSDGVLSDGPITEVTRATISTTSIAFGTVDVGETSEIKSVTVTNTSTSLPIQLEALSVSGDYEFSGVVPPLGRVINAGETMVVGVVFKPTVRGIANGVLSIKTSAEIGDNLQAAMSGVGHQEMPLARLKISGAKLLSTETDEEVILKSVNWFGAEGTSYTPHGTWLRPWKSIINNIKAMGFNCIRLPFSGDFTAPGRAVPAPAINAEQNPDLVGLAAIEIFDLIIDYCLEQKIYVVLDHHRRHAGDGADGGPTSADYTQADWETSWTRMATRYKDNLAVVGADVHNEPHDLTWANWATAAEACGKKVLATAPDWLIFVEGVGADGDDHYWWGGYLKGVATRPVNLGVPNKVVYSPHEYGQSVGSQTWLAQDGQTPPTNWPANLPGVWDAYWGFIVKQGIAPLWIGEFGGHFGVDGAGNLTKPNAVSEGQWGRSLVNYLKANKISFAYWSYNPNSGDTGGLVQDDWITNQTVKLDLIEPLFDDSPVSPAETLVDDDLTELTDDDGTLLEDDA